MADLALRLKVFVASPGDLISERDIVERLVGAHAQECQRHRLLLQCFRWENGVTPGYERPQSRINRQLRTAELTVVMFWTRLGSAATLGGEETAAQEELRLAGELVETGISDDVFVYFKTAEPPAAANAVDVERVRQLRQGLEHSKHVFSATFETQLEFEDAFRRHLRLWVERWVGVPEICEFALDHSAGSATPADVLSDARLHQVLCRVDLDHAQPALSILGRVAVDAYQREGPTAWVRPLPSDAASCLRRLPGPLVEALLDGRDHDVEDGSSIPLAPTPLARAGHELHFADAEWFYFCCAHGLTEAIAARRVEAVARRPYINPVHQYLKGLVQERRALGRLSPVLRGWLANRDGSTANRPVARNFAAYVIGMLGDVDAQEDLARAIAEDSGRDVRLYCVTSLGKLRARQQLPVLKELYGREPNPQFRLTVAQAICRMTGVADYEM